MKMQTSLNPSFWAITKHQLLMLIAILSLIAVVAGIYYVNDRNQEWQLRKEQSIHRLDLALDLITRDFNRVQSDVLFLASEKTIRNFDPRDELSRREVENSLINFLRYMGTYQQIRLIDLGGKEMVRVELRGSNYHVVDAANLQDKKDRYYVRESVNLGPTEVFVSDFDLNQEHGIIEEPVNPVIRFVVLIASEPKFLLVANYKGTTILGELAEISLPGMTYLIRDDGQFLLGPSPPDAWGWLLGHNAAFPERFPLAWNSRFRQDTLFLTPNGAFAYRKVDLAQPGKRVGPGISGTDLFLVSHHSNEEVFNTSELLLQRLAALALIIFVPLVVLTRLWSSSSLRRQLQNKMIKESEGKLRELSARLVKIQEDERKLISREIHDQLGQQATAINLDLKLAMREVEQGKLKEQLERGVLESEQLLQTLQDFALRIRPVELDDLGLHDAVDSHMSGFAARFGLEHEFHSNISNIAIPMEIAENAYRLVQESLNNVLKHANASKVVVSIHHRVGTVTSDRELTIEVKDDGGGIKKQVAFNDSADATKSRSKLGILGMRERVDLLNGMIEIDSSNGGTLVKIIIPFANNPNESCK